MFQSAFHVYDFSVHFVLIQFSYFTIWLRFSLSLQSRYMLFKTNTETHLRSWSEPSSDFSSLLFINGNFLLNEKFFFFLSNVDCWKFGNITKLHCILLWVLKLSIFLKKPIFPTIKPQKGWIKCVMMTIVQRTWGRIV